MTAHEAASVTWRITSASVRGASHIRSGLPNQDAEGWLGFGGGGLVAAVADGHGNATYVRSDRGAQFAVSAALSCSAEALEAAGGSLSSLKRLLDEALPRAIWERWSMLVTDDAQSNAFTELELAIVMRTSGDSSVRRLHANPLLAYGTTLLVAALAPNFMAFLQIGDGDIIVVDEFGQSVEPIEHDARLIANETTSLCLPNAWREFRSSFQQVIDAGADCVLLSTDGWANSFADRDGFLKVGSDVRTFVESSGRLPRRDEIEPWLSEASRAGSGDDVTLAIAHREKVQRG